MLAMTTAGYTGSRSPNRLDVLVWGVTSLFPKIISEAKAQNDAGFLGGQRLPMGGSRQVQVNTSHNRWKRTGR